MTILASWCFGSLDSTWMLSPYLCKCISFYAIACMLKVSVQASIHLRSLFLNHILSFYFLFFHRFTYLFLFILSYTSTHTLWLIFLPVCLFCKFFFIGIMLFPQHLPLLSGFMVQVNSIITLPPVTFELPARDTSKEKTVKISPPSVYTGASSVQFRLISSEYREGQVSIV